MPGAAAVAVTPRHRAHVATAPADGTPTAVAALRETFTRLRSSLARMRSCSCDAASPRPPGARTSYACGCLDDVDTFLFHALIPFVEALRVRLYPQLRRFAGDPGLADTGEGRATAHLARWGDQITVLRAEVARGGANPALVADVEAAVSSLSVSMEAHLAAAQTRTLAVFERLPGDVAERLLAALDRTEQAARERPRLELDVSML